MSNIRDSLSKEDFNSVDQSILQDLAVKIKTLKKRKKRFNKNLYDVTKYKIGKIYIIKHPTCYNPRNNEKVEERIFRVKIRTCPICHLPCIMRRYRNSKSFFDRKTGEVSRIEYFDATECCHKFSIFPEEADLIPFSGSSCKINKKLTELTTFRRPKKIIIRMK